MDFTGGRSEFNLAGASYRFGACSAQCSVSPYFNGQVNTEGLGACSHEIDLWEANSMATVYTPHPCTIEGIYGCKGDECGSNSVCNESGCGGNSYQQDDTSFYGPSLVIDTTKTFTVTTQFITDDGTTTGKLTEIRLFYTQNGVLYPNPVSTSPSGLNYIDEEFCSATDIFGGLKAHG
jgi:cellulase